MEIEIRAARPEDADDAAPLIYSWGPASFDYVFSRREDGGALRYLRKAIRSKGGEFGYGCHHVGVLDGAIVATGASFSGRDAFGFLVKAFKGIAFTYGPIRGVGVIRRGLQVERIVQPPHGDLHYIAHIGVTPDLRGRGIGTEIVKHLLDIGKKLGRTTAALDVSVENPRAEALYERMSFAVTAERISHYKNDTASVPSHRRMEFAL